MANKLPKPEELGCAVNKLDSDGQITEWRIHTYLFDGENARCCDLGVRAASKSSPKTKPHFTITSSQKDVPTNALTSSLAETLLLKYGALLSPHRMQALKASDA